MPTNDIPFERLEYLLAHATPGPWTLSDWGTPVICDCAADDSWDESGMAMPVSAANDVKLHSHIDAQLIVALRNQAAALIAAAKAGRAANGKTGSLRSLSAGARGTENLRLDPITPISLRRLVEASAKEPKKYGVNRWQKGISASEMLDRAVNHVRMWLRGDTAEDHLAHAAWNLLAICHFEETMSEMIDVPLRRGWRPQQTPKATNYEQAR